MANSQPLGAGDGPANVLESTCNTSSPSPWTNMPIPVFDILGSKMDAKGLREMRLVCTEWLKNVEENVSLKVKVDDRVEGNVEFVRRVKVGGACVRNWTVDIGTEPASVLFQHPGWLKKLKLCGKMPAQWKLHSLREFPSLAHLVLRDFALYANNMTDPQYPVINFDLTSQLSLDEMMIQAYQTQDPPSKTEPIELKNLKTLEIVKNPQGYLELPKHSWHVMTANICFILSHVTSPLLSVVNLSVNQPRQFDDLLWKKLNWTLEHLHRFLNTHRTTLRQVFLAYTKYSDLIEDESLSNSFPVNLRKLSLNIFGFDPSNSQDPQIQTTFTYLQKLLQGQTQLQEVQFDFLSFPIKWTTDAFTCLVNSCSSTLRYLQLNWYPNDNSASLDLQILSVCQSLEVLHLKNYYHLWYRQTTLTFKNVDKLPSSLKILVIRCRCNSDDDKVEIGDPSFFKRLTGLEWLCLDNILPPADSNDGNQEPRWKFCRDMIKGLLGLRKLKGFQLRVLYLNLNMDESLVAMLSPLNPDNEEASRYPSRAHFNFKSPSQSYLPDPWTDRPFDRSIWDLEKYQDD